ncbi:MFS transporter [uncultured Leifsonia sp.]|uniref:MFS transporter n=1 Tax=uncultured Leifsonia sp. TaxID=340359 RepID=UPI0028D4FDB5|nr:MFS transporter [uncultured Leifsonia sp.]
MSSAPQPLPGVETTAVASHPVEANYARKAVFASAIGYGLDGFDLLILSFALSGIIASFQLSDPQAATLTTVTLLGAVTGGLIFGLLSDRFGRVRMLTISVIVFGVFTGLSAIAVGYWDLAAYRFLAGVGIGGEFGIGMTLAAEAVPAKWRARATGWVAIGFQVGVLAAALISAPVIAAFGWRALFVVGAVPALVALIFRSRLHESPKFLENRDTAAGAAAQGDRPRSRVRLLFGDARTTRITIALTVLASVQNFGYFGIMTWLPRYLGTQFGLNLASTSVWTAVTVVGMMLGIFTFGVLADKIGRRVTFWIIQMGAIVSLLVYSQLSDPIALLIGGFVMGFFANGMLGCLGALMAEQYPTDIRATAQNLIFNVGRGIAGFAPIVIALVAGVGGFPLALSLLPAIYILAFFTMFAIPERRGEELN